MRNERVTDAMDFIPDLACKRPRAARTSRVRAKGRRDGCSHSYQKSDVRPGGNTKRLGPKADTSRHVDHRTESSGDYNAHDGTGNRAGELPVT